MDPHAKRRPALVPDDADLDDGLRAEIEARTGQPPVYLPDYKDDAPDAREDGHCGKKECKNCSDCKDCKNCKKAAPSDSTTNTNNLMDLAKVMAERSDVAENQESKDSVVDRSNDKEFKGNGCCGGCKNEK